MVVGELSKICLDYVARRALSAVAELSGPMFAVGAKDCKFSVGIAIVAVALKCIFDDGFCSLVKVESLLGSLSLARGESGGKPWDDLGSGGSHGCDLFGNPEDLHVELASFEWSRRDCGSDVDMPGVDGRFIPNSRGSLLCEVPN